MRKIVIQRFLLKFIFSHILFSFFWIGNAKGQMVYLPDTNFRNKLIASGYASCIVGDSINSSCTAVANCTVLNVSNSNIRNLQGINAFHNIRYFYCNQNQLTTLPVFITPLIYLDCSHNQISSIPVLPASLTNLDCSYNQLSHITVLPASLTTLYCFENQFSFLPPLPSGLQNLYCHYNQLLSLPVLPASLVSLICNNNQLASLPTLPIELWDLYCDYNQLTTLPMLPDSLNYLHCSNNQITILPELPDSLNYFDCSNNTNLFCLPQLKRIVSLNFSNTSVSCLPNYGIVSNSNPLLSSLPLCGLFNSNGCSSFNNFTGKTYYDSNTNCNFDSTDNLLWNMHIMLFKSGNLLQQTFTGSNGYYSFNVNDSLGAYEIKFDTSNVPFTLICPSNMQYNDTLTATDSLFYDNDFSLECKPGFDVGSFSIVSSGFRPAVQTTVTIHAGDITNFYGAHCAEGISGTVTIILSGPAGYISPVQGALVPTTVSGDTLIYVVSDFGLVDLFSSFNIIVRTDTLAPFGSQVCLAVSITPAIGDNNPANNILTHCFTVFASFDPNDKMVYPAGDIDINGDKWLTYTIRFQNTGTAQAEHIYIIDSLDQNLDLSSFQLLAYSHQPSTQILEGGITRFNFPNINLPDSNSNEPLSHGYVQYKVKMKDNIAVGSQISNTGYIYFDFNAPMVTNTTVNTVISPVGLDPVKGNELQFSVFPNPSKQEFTVSCLQFPVGRKVVLRVFDILGKEILVESMQSSSVRLSISRFQAGVYFLRIETDLGSIVKKLIKE